MPNWIETPGAAVRQKSLMNRIRHIRERQGVTQAELARRVGTSQPQIQRLEDGERRLTVGWMQRIAKALDVRPADLIATATLAEADDEIVSATPTEIAGQLASIGLQHATAAADSVAMAGIANGAPVLIDRRPSAIDTVKTGDVVLLSATSADRPAPVLLLRLYIAPGLFVTNRPGSNMAFRADDPEIISTIVGVVVPATS